MLNDDELERQADDVFDGDLHRYKRAAQRIIAQLPTIAPVKHGKWVRDVNKDGYLMWICSICKCEKHKKRGLKFCPNCGARMDGDE